MARQPYLATCWELPQVCKLLEQIWIECTKFLTDNQISNFVQTNQRVKFCNLLNTFKLGINCTIGRVITNTKKVTTNI